MGVAGLFTTSALRVTIKCSLTPAPAACACTGFPWLPWVFTRVEPWHQWKSHFSPPPWFCEMSKIQLVLLSLFFYTLCSWFHTVTNAAWLRISALKVDCPNECRKQSDATMAKVNSFKFQMITCKAVSKHYSPCASSFHEKKNPTTILNNQKQKHFHVFSYVYNIHILYHHMMEKVGDFLFTFKHSSRNV